LVHFPLTWLSAIPGILAGHSAISRIRADRRSKGMVIAIIGMAFCYLNLAALTARVVYHFASGEKGWGRISSQSTARNSNPVPGISPNRTAPVRKARPTAAQPVIPREPRVATDPAKVEIAATPVTGTISGQNFTCDRAVLQTGHLTLSQGPGFTPAFRVQIPLQLKWGDSISGKQFLISSFATTPPGILLSCQQPGKWNSDILSRNYVLRLEFGEPITGRIRGKIYLEASPSHKTKFEGTFQAEMK
jgi:hypothetical protein